MLSASSDRIDATVVDFFSRMNQECVEYALLRNYENYPRFGHDIDLVVRWRDLPKLAAIAKCCAIDHGWSALVACNHWARSSSPVHTIQIHRFFSIDPPQYLQIDAFHSFIVLGLPFFDEDNLLRGRIKDPRGFYRINNHTENFYRLFQIASMATSKRAAEKTNRYRERAMSFWENAGDPAPLEGAVVPDMSTAVDLLRKGALRAFRNEVRRRSVTWWIEQVSEHPFRSGKIILDRLLDLPMLWLRPCGFILRVFADDNIQRKRLERIVQRLVAENVFITHTFSRNILERRRVRFVGGIVFVWTSAERADVIVEGQAGDQSVEHDLLIRIIKRHPILLEPGRTSN